MTPLRSVFSLNVQNSFSFLQMSSNKLHWGHHQEAFLENCGEGSITEKSSTLLANVRRNNEKPPVNDALELFFHSETGNALEYM